MNYTKGMKVKLCEAYFLGRFPCSTFAGLRTIEGNITLVEEKFIYIQVTWCDASTPNVGKIIRRRKQGVYRTITILSAPATGDQVSRMKNQLTFYLRLHPVASDITGTFIHSLINNS